MGGDHSTTDPRSADVWADRINEAYHDGMGVEFGRRTRDRVNWMCAQARGHSVLDVGCSQGIASILLGREGLRVTGIDIYPPAVEYAVRELGKELPSVRERVNFQCVDLADFSSGTFDTVLLGEVVEHQTNPGRFIERAASLVGNLGRIVLTVPFGLHPWPDHKSTIFPSTIASVLEADFSIEVLDVSDGYIRLVADRRPAGTSAVGTYHALALVATERGAFEWQRRFYELSEERQAASRVEAERAASLKRAAERASTLETARAELDKTLALRSQALESLQVQLADARETAQRERYVADERRDALGVELQRVEELLRQVNAGSEASERAARVIAKLESEKAALDKARARIEGDLSATAKELAEARRRIDEATDAANASAKQATEAQAQLDEKVMENASLLLAEERLKASVAELNERLQALQSELVVAQTKRNGHYLHLEAERSYNRKLVALLGRLHEENQRYQHSIAFAIGSAFVNLRSARGVVAFPGALLRAWRAFRARKGGGLEMAQLQLPDFVPAVLPAAAPAGLLTPSGGTLDDRPNGGRAAANSRAEEKADRQRKQLSIMGWAQAKPDDKPLVMSVLDDFSRVCFAPHAGLVEPRPDNWEGLLESCAPKFLFVESSWKGNYGSWQYRVSNYAHPPGKELQEMVRGFQSRRLPTVFWNKEDPVHFSNFIESASKFDLILTTAAEAVPMYEERSAARVGVLQFAAEESLHNPVGSGARNGKVCFAGSFYANRFKERKDDQLMLLDAASSFDFDIFDRNHRAGAAVRSDFCFPERFDPFIKGALSYEKLSRAYRDYSVFLNVNSVIDSPTMFSRRIFELLACGTPVVSTWSRGIEETFGDGIVWHVRSREEAEEAIHTLLTDKAEWRRRSLAGIRAVMAKHTYRHRFEQVCGLLGIDRAAPDPFADVLVVAHVRSEEEARAVGRSFERQRMDAGTRKRLMVLSSVPVDPALSLPEVEVVVDQEKDLGALFGRIPCSGRESMLAVFSPHALYGSNFLQDSLHACRYSGASIVGRPRDPQSVQHRFDVELDARTLVVNRSKMTSGELHALLADKAGYVSSGGPRTYALDAANYVLSEDVLDPDSADARLRAVEF